MAITGSAGGNELAYKVTGGMGSASMITLPRLTFTGFDKSASLATFFGADFVELAAGDANNYVLKASNAIGKLGFEQDLFGNDGDDTLIGSVGHDYMGGGAGTDKVYGKDGDDILIISSATAPVSGDLFDGGSGTDFLYVFGPSPVNFAGTLVSIEGVRVGRNTTLVMTADQMRMLPDALKVSGLATGLLSITNAHTFSAASFDFLANSSPKIGITGTTASDILTGSSADDQLSGSDGSDQLIGGVGNDRLSGDAGVDTLTGGLGSDTFVFGSGAKSVARDTIIDFNSAGGDRIALTQTGFAAVHQTNGILNAEKFYAAAGARAAHDANDRIVYNTNSGVLYYDADGLGGQAAVAIALLKGHPTLAAADVVIL